MKRKTKLHGWLLKFDRIFSESVWQLLGGIGHRVDSVLTTHLWRECSKPDVLGVGVVYPD